MATSPIRWSQIKPLFEATVELPAAAREPLIAAAALDAEALAELRSLLAHQLLAQAASGPLQPEVVLGLAGAHDLLARAKAP